MKIKMKYILYVMVIIFLYTPVFAFAEEGDAASTEEVNASAVEETETVLPGEAEPIILKMMVVNPSDKHKQTFPLKAYLPEEVRPEHILDKEDMQVSYDDEKSSYYVTQEIELEPSESVIKTVKLRDVWRLSESELEAFSEEAHSLLNNLVGTKYEEQGRLLLSNVEVLLIQIYESQRDRSLTPEEHISAYRENKSKKDDIEMDLLALRRFVVNSGGELGIPFLKSKSSGGAMGLPGMVTDWESKTEAERLEAMMKGAGGGAAGRGQIPAWMLWRMIFIVLFFIGGLSLLFFLIWAHQLNTMRNRKKENVAKTAPPDHKDVQNKGVADADEIKLGDFLHTNEIEPEEEKKAS